MAYRAARRWGVQPSEFWAKSTQEFWWEFDSHMDEQKALKGYKAGAGGFSEAEWEDARRRHTEKMNGGT